MQELYDQFLKEKRFLDNLSPRTLKFKVFNQFNGEQAPTNLFRAIMTATAKPTLRSFVRRIRFGMFCKAAPTLCLPSNGVFQLIFWLPEIMTATGKRILLFGDRATEIGMIRKSSDGMLFAVTFGQNGDTPLVGDFDGDRKTDFAFVRSDSTSGDLFWNVLKSSGGTFVRQFGLSSDKFVLADYDGDGTTDFGVWRPSNGSWFTTPSSESDPSHNFTSIQFGQNGDIPVPGDFNGDGIYDRAVFRSGTWIIQDLSNGTYSSQTFGLGTDKPIPTTYFP